MEFNKTISIGNNTIGANKRVFIIGEAGVNHGGDINVAKQLVDIAVEAGVDAVKFQAFRTSDVIIENVQKAPYQSKTTEQEESQTDMLRKLELKQEQYIELKGYCESKNIIFLITPFDEGSLIELEEIGVVAYKVASTDTTNLPFLRKIAATGKPIFLSTGMTYLKEIRIALEEIQSFNKDVILMQCTANYPIEDTEANLNVIRTFQNEFDILTGYSDHSMGIGAAPYALPMGICMIEKHFTLDKDESGPDHRASLDPKELKSLVQEVRRIEKYLGSFIKEPTESELKTRKSLQKNLVAKIDIKMGDILSDENVVAKRTGGEGISPINYKEVFGSKAPKAFSRNEVITI
jgi:N,N'-diacetyllegionaminate synthase